MTYRDDLEAAHARIAVLESERAPRPARFESADASAKLFAKYLEAVLAGRIDDPIVVVVQRQLGQADFHEHVKLFVAALAIEGRTFTLDAHQGLRDAIGALLATAAVVDRALRDETHA